MRVERFLVSVNIVDLDQMVQNKVASGERFGYPLTFVPLPGLGIELQLYIFVGNKIIRYLVGKEIGKKLIGKN